jgi:hypothetical protein
VLAVVIDALALRPAELESVELGALEDVLPLSVSSGDVPDVDPPFRVEVER